MKLKLTSLIILVALVLSMTGCILKFAPPAEEPEEPEIPEEPETPEEPEVPEPSGPVVSTADGYTFETFADDTVYPVADMTEASEIIDRAIMSHLVSVTLDCSSISADFDPAVDFDHQCEFASHVSLRCTYSADEPTLLTVGIRYKTTAASVASTPTPEHSYVDIPSANDILSRAKVPADERRPEDFGSFPIDVGKRESLAVYNSEELWWAVEHGYRPTFAVENSTAERIYEKARAVLREIISTNMNDFEKALAIYEYLIANVTYDYDTYNALDVTPTADNVCYYLEGVFDYGRAVCDGKSKAFVLLCGIEGISAVREFGYSLTGESGHAWNYARIDGVWYLVDTTNGDAAKKNPDSPIAEFYGENVELINYKLFLAPISAYIEKYEYSTRWREITSTDVGQSRIADVLVNRRAEMLISSAEEFAEILHGVISLGVEEFTVTVSIAPLTALFYGENLPHLIADDATEILELDGRLERLIFKENIDSNKNYMYVFKLAPAADDAA